MMFLKPFRSSSLWLVPLMMTHLAAEEAFQPDFFDSLAGNETREAASGISPLSRSNGKVWSQLANIHLAGDIDWYQALPGEAGSYEIIALDGTLGSDATPNIEVTYFNGSGALLGQLQRQPIYNPRAIGALVANGGEIIFIKVEALNGQTGPYQLQMSLVEDDEVALSRINPPAPDETPLPIPSDIQRFVSSPQISLSSPDLGMISLDADRDEYGISLEEDQGMFVRVRSKAKDLSVDLFSVVQRANRWSDGGYFMRYYSVAPKSFSQDGLLRVAASSFENIGEYEVSVRYFDEFDQWIVDQFIQTQDYGDDRNGDGLPIGLVWALGLSVDVDYRADLKLNRLSTGEYQFTVPSGLDTRKRDVVIQRSSDLENWVNVADASVSTGSAVIAANSTNSVVVTMPAAGQEPCFVRLKMQ